MTAHHTFEDGLVEGKIQAIEAIVSRHDVRLNGHADRLHLLERALWLTLGVVIAIEFLPTVIAVVNAGAGL